MCGIAGFYAPHSSYGKEKRKQIGKTISDVIAHRGPDHGEIWQDENLPLIFAHRRLSIVDLSKDGNQPMVSATGRYVLNFNGEFYNFLSLRAELEERGIGFRGRSDTEVFLAAIEEWGLSRALQKTQGMFAFALFDKQKKELHFVRDRLGKKPLYIGWAGKNLIFGSELKAIRAYPDFEAKLDQNVLASYLRYAYVPAPHCIYQNMFQLLPGHRLDVKLDELEAQPDLKSLMNPYWNAVRVMDEARHKVGPSSEDAALQQFESLLGTCVKERMISDVPLGAFLSGGIDSSAITALMQKHSGSSVKTYTIGFSEAGFNEAEYAKNIANHLGTDHHELYVSGQDALNLIPDLPKIYDEPFADISALPTTLLSRFARQDVTVALSGDGGDEMLGGYNRHIEGPKIWKSIRFIPPPLRPFVGHILRVLPPGFWKRVKQADPGHIQKALELFSSRSQKDLYKRVVSQFYDPAKILLQSDEVDLDSAWQLPDDLSLAEKMMVWDTISYLPGDILTKVDRASMDSGLEVRAPLLDARLYHYVWQLPQSLKIREGNGKYLLRQLLQKYVPDHLFERPKQGFSMPVGEWLKGPLKDWAEDLLDEKKLKEQGLFQAENVRLLWSSHLNNQGNHAIRLWTILMFLAWQEKYL